jgi:DNA-binding response OmpR family regulator
VLLFLDDRVLAQTIRLALNHGRFLIDLAQNAVEAARVLGHMRPHLAIVDMDVYKGDTMERLGYAETGATRVPVIGLTRRGDLRAKLDAFDQGVDDVVSVPFSPEELVARVLAVLRRSYHGPVQFTPQLRVGELEIDIMNRSVRIRGSELHLTSLQCSLLYLLAANAGQLLTRDQILDYLWGPDYVAESNVVDRHIRDLRAQLQNSWRRPRYIATVPGKGYRFIPASEQEMSS